MRSNLSVQSHFTYVPSPDPSVKTLLANCIRCKKYSKAKNTTQQQEHLLECTAFAEWKKANQSKSKNSEQQILTTMLLPRLDPARKARIDQKFANAIFESGSPFSLFEHPAFKEAFAELGYTPPNRKVIGDKLLQESYNECQKDVANQLSHSNLLTLTTDESTNVSSNKIINYYVTTSNSDSFFIKSVEALVGTLSAKVVLDGIVETC